MKVKFREKNLLRGYINILGKIFIWVGFVISTEYVIRQDGVLSNFALKHLIFTYGFFYVGYLIGLIWVYVSEAEFIREGHKR